VLTTSGDETAKLWSIESGACTQTFAGPGYILHTRRRVDDGDGYVPSAAFSPDGTSVLVTSANTAKLWMIESGECIQTFEGHGGEVEWAGFSL